MIRAKSALGTVCNVETHREPKALKITPPSTAGLKAASHGRASASRVCEQWPSRRRGARPMRAAH